MLWWRPQATEPAEEEGGGLRRGRLYTIEDQWLLRYGIASFQAFDFAQMLKRALAKRVGERVFTDYVV